MTGSDVSHEGATPSPGRRARVQTPAPRGTELVDRTAELTADLASPDAELRDAQALPLLLSWINAGAHDHVLAALGDGMTDGLFAGRDDDDWTHVLRRAGSAQILTAVVRRDNDHRLLHPETVLDWAEHVFGWIVREPNTASTDARNPRSPSAVGHGSDALAALADSRHFDRIALTVLLDVAGDRLLAPQRLSPVDLDLMARATAHAMAREELDHRINGPWIQRIANGAATRRASSPAAENAHAFLRSLHLRISLGSERFASRSDALISLADAVRGTSPALFEG